MPLKIELLRKSVVVASFSANDVVLPLSPSNATKNFNNFNKLAYILKDFEPLKSRC